MGGSKVSHDDKGRVKLSSVPLDRALSMIVHTDDIDIANDRDDVMEITAQDTIAMADRFTERTWAMAKQDEDFKSRLHSVFVDIDIATDPRELRDYPIAIRHVVGMIVCINKAINTGKSPFVRYPETYLHPSSQTRVAQLLARYAAEAEEAKREAERIYTDRSDDSGSNSGDHGNASVAGVSEVADDALRAPAVRPEATSGAADDTPSE